MKFFYLLCILPFLSFAQVDVATGVVVSKVLLEEDNDRTYAIYLPRGYSKDKSYSAVFVFDELGRGASIVQRFSIGAELTNSIVIGANYVLNDTVTVALKESEQLINKSYELYAINERKVILAGNGNGALVASSSAQLSQEIYGVVAVNDIFLDKKLLRKNPEFKISLISGDEDKRFYKLRSYSKDPGYNKFIKGYHVFDGIGWPEAGYLAASLTELLLDNDTSIEVVKEYYDSDLSFGSLLYRQQRHLYAYRFVSGLKKKYKKRLDVEEQKELIKKIRGNASYRAKRNQQALFRYEENLLAEDFQYYLQEDTSNAFFDNLGWWSSQMDDLDAKIDNTSQVPLATKSAIRLKRYVQYAVEQQYGLMQLGQSKTEKLLFVNILRTLVNPTNQDAFIQVIALSAQEGDYNAAYFYLEELLKTGYDNYDQLYEIPYTTPVIIGPEWNEIVKAYLGKSRYF